MSEYNYIVNPTTGRKVNVSGRVGKSIINNYLKYGMIGSGKKISKSAKNIKLQDALNSDTLNESLSKDNQDKYIHVELDLINSKRPTIQEEENWLPNIFN